MSSDWAHSPRPYRAITGLYSYIPTCLHAFITQCVVECAPGLVIQLVDKELMQVKNLETTGDNFTGRVVLPVLSVFKISTGNKYTKAEKCASICHGNWEVKSFKHGQHDKLILVFYWLITLSVHSTTLR